MPLQSPITPGTVDWTGENPGIILHNPDGSPAAMALFFRIAWSPVGQGTVLLLYGTPAAAHGPAHAPNLLMSDNRALADFLKNSFIGLLKRFRDAPAFATLAHRDIVAARSSGDPMGHRYTETVIGRGLTVELVWENLEPPVAVELPPELTGTGLHTMFSLLVPARAAQILVNGQNLPGTIGKRVQAGFETTTAFLYFSETWISAPAA